MNSISNQNGSSNSAPSPNTPRHYRQLVQEAQNPAAYMGSGGGGDSDTENSTPSYLTAALTPSKPRRSPHNSSGGGAAAPESKTTPAKTHQTSGHNAAANSKLPLTTPEKPDETGLPPFTRIPLSKNPQQADVRKGYTVKLYNILDRLFQNHSDSAEPLSPYMALTLGGSAYLGKSAKKGTIFGESSDYDLKLAVSPEAMFALLKNEWPVERGPKFMSEQYLEQNTEDRIQHCLTLKLYPNANKKKKTMAYFFKNILRFSKKDTSKLMRYFKHAYRDHEFSLYVQGLGMGSVADTMEHSIVLLAKGALSTNAQEILSSKPNAADTIQAHFDKYSARYEKNARHGYAANGSPLERRKRKAENEATTAAENLHPNSPSGAAKKIQCPETVRQNFQFSPESDCAAAANPSRSADSAAAAARVAYTPEARTEENPWFTHNSAAKTLFK